MSPRAADAMNLPDAAVPWWAIGLLDLDDPEHRNLRRARSFMELGLRARANAGHFWEAWADCIDMAKAKVMQRPLDDWIDEAYAQTDPTSWAGGPITAIVRDAALRSTRTFSTMVGLNDDEGLPIVFKDFHVQTVVAMRRYEFASILLPFEFGKSYLNNIVVPLMDWAEWPDATEGRIYWNDSHVTRWIKRLMQQVEHNERLHKIFPWVAKPRKGDPGWGLWGTRGFSIRGRTLPDKAFEPLTANQFSTGNRYSRVGGDDWVNSANAKILTVQDRLVDYWKSGPETMKQVLQRTSKYSTAWPSAYLCGTVFDVNDVNSRINAEYRMARRGGDRRYRALRFDCFTSDEETQTIWPERRSLEYMQALRISLTERIFNMRCRNMVSGSKSRVFPREYVLAAEWNGTDRPPFEWGVPPERMIGGVIGFDPGSGKLTKESKNPAYFVYGQRDARPLLMPGLLRDPRLPQEVQFDPAQEADIFHHGVEWGRLEGYSFTAQCDKLIELGRRYRLPVAFEDNATQGAYGDYIRKIAPDVRLFAHTTGPGGGDPRAGVEQFEPLFKNGRMILHCANAPHREVLALREELTQWKGRYTDIVMAMWIARHQSEEHFAEMPDQLRLATPNTPMYLHRIRNFRR